MLMKTQRDRDAMLLKYTLAGLIVTRLSVASAADPLKQNPLNFSPTKNAPRADEVKPDVIPIHLYAKEGSLDGDYKFKYETGNGIFAEEHGVMTNKGTENEANSVVGAYRYTSPEGVPIEVRYTAGVDGFKAYGAHLPVVGGTGGGQARFAGPPQFGAEISGPASGGDEQPRVSYSPLQRQGAAPSQPQQRLAATQKVETADHPELPASPKQIPELRAVSTTPAVPRYPDPAWRDAAGQRQWFNLGRRPYPSALGDRRPAAVPLSEIVMEPQRVMYVSPHVQHPQQYFPNLALG